MDTTSRKKGFLVITVIFIFVSILSASRFHFYDSHECTGERCVVCAQLENTKNTVQQFVSNAPYVLPATLLIHIILFFLGLHFYAGPTSLVALKVRLDH